MLFGHGDDTAVCSKPVEGNFSSNVWYEGFLDSFSSVISDAAAKIGHYPEADAASLREAIAVKEGIAAANVIAGNGAIELIYLIAQAWAGSRSVVVVPTFREYEDAAALHKHQLSFITEEQLMTADFTGADLVWLCNPNNPTGKVTGRSQLLEVISASKDTLFVVDQSYLNYCTEELLSCNDVLACSNLIVLCSLTKCYSIPGIRVGYLVAAEALSNRMLGYRIPWSVNVIAVELAKHIVKNANLYPLPLQRWMRQKEQLAEAIQQLGMFDVLPSETPYFLVKLRKGTSAQLKSFLADGYSLLIRDASNFRGLDNTYIRISAQDEATNGKLINALKKWMDTL